jgi:hypothetical protein
MARARRATPARATTSNGGSTLTCPECGKPFTRAASLGAHRNRAHGVVGASKAAQRRSGSGRSGARSTASAPATRRQAARPRTSRSSSDGFVVNRDALLQAIFPNGVPAREEVIRRANAWLDEAEKLQLSYESRSLPLEERLARLTISSTHLKRGATR